MQKISKKIATLFTWSIEIIKNTKNLMVFRPEGTAIRKSDAYFIGLDFLVHGLIVQRSTWATGYSFERRILALFSNDPLGGFI